MSFIIDFSDLMLLKPQIFPPPDKAFKIAPVKAPPPQGLLYKRIHPK